MFRRKHSKKYNFFSNNWKLDNGKAIKYKINFFDSFRFISSSLSYFVYNLSKGLHNDKCIDCKSCID